MAREPRTEPTIPDEVGLREGLQSAFQLFAGEVDLQHAVGETGVLRGEVEVFLDKGRGKHYKGAVWFQRRMETQRG